MRRRSTFKYQNADGIPLLLDEDPTTKGTKAMSRSSVTWVNAEQGIASNDSTSDEIVTNDDIVQQLPKSGGKGGLLTTTVVVLLFILPAFCWRTSHNNDFVLQQQRRELSNSGEFAYMDHETNGWGGGSSCENGNCLWDPNRCIRVPYGGQDQCGMYLEEIDTYCGQWDECGGVICSQDYIVDGHEVCLARRKIDMGAYAQGRTAIVKSGMVDLLHRQNFGDKMSLLPGELGGGTSCVNGKCLWNDVFCQNFNGQCAIPIKEIETKCGNWDECQGVVCRKDYVLNGQNVCLARGRIDLTAVTPGMMAVAKPTVSTMDKDGDIVCSSESRFEPKKDTYYRIQTHDSKTDDDFVWTYDKSDLHGKVLLANDESKDDPKSHWRFVEENRGSGVWQIVNRATGDKIMVEQYETNLAVLPSYLPDPELSRQRARYQKALEFRGFCNNNKVRFNSAVLPYYLEDEEGGQDLLLEDSRFSKHDTFWIRPSGDMGGSSRTTLRTSSYGPFERQVRYTSCSGVAMMDDCPSGYNLVNEEPSSCGFLGLGSHRKCIKEPVSKNQLTKWDWVLEPVTEYKRPDRKEGPVLKAKSAPEEVIGGLAASLTDNTLWVAAGFMAFETALGPLGAVGAPLLCFILDATVFQSESEDSNFNKILEDFGDQILEITENMVWEGVSKESLHGVLSDVKSVRNQYLLQYMGEKKTDVKDAQNLDEYSLGKVDNLSNDLQKYANDYLKHFNRLFPLSKQDEEEIDAVRTRHAWDSMKLIALEMLTAWEERVALEAYMSYAEKIQSLGNPLTCKQIIEDNIQIQMVLVDKIRDQFENAHSLLLKKGKQMAKEGYEQGERDSATGMPYTEKYIGEITWDIKQFSYKYDEVTAALDVFNERVKKTCEAIIDTNGNDEVRERWRLFDPKNKASFENSLFV